MVEHMMRYKSVRVRDYNYTDLGYYPDCMRKLPAGYKPGDYLCTDKLEEVTCKRCLKKRRTYELVR